MRVLVTGGLGCVGANYTAHRLRRGDQVVVLDNGARGKSNQLNLAWLRVQERESSGKLVCIDGSVTSWSGLLQALGTYGGVDEVVHAAAQSSVDVSMERPLLDFEWNVQGTVYLLEALRVQCPTARMVFLASNKIYDVTEWPVELIPSSIGRGLRRYQWAGRRVGPSEQRPFHTDAKEPYGASKICGFYYSRCYAAMYGMPIVICVPSGMYGARQFGKSEQGWLAWFVCATELGLPIMIHGDGAQVRDMLDVRDVCSALDLMLSELAPKYPGEVFNLGGGPRNAISLLEALSLIEAELGKAPNVSYGDWRPHDNQIYVSNIERMVQAGWAPAISVQQGIKDLCVWVKEARKEIEGVYSDHS